MFKVEKGIEFKKRPLEGRVATRHMKYPFDQMAIGDSFLMPFDSATSRKSLQCGVYQAATVRGLKIKTQKLDDGVRVWRIA